MLLQKSAQAFGKEDVAEARGSNLAPNLPTDKEREAADSSELPPDGGFGAKEEGLALNLPAAAEDLETMTGARGDALGQEEKVSGPAVGPAPSEIPSSDDWEKAETVAAETGVFTGDQDLNLSVPAPSAAAAGQPGVDAAEELAPQVKFEVPVAADPAQKNGQGQPVVDEPRPSQDGVQKQQIPVTAPVKSEVPATAQKSAPVPPFDFKAETIRQAAVLATRPSKSKDAAPVELAGGTASAAKTGSQPAAAVQLPEPKAAVTEFHSFQADSQPMGPLNAPDSSASRAPVEAATEVAPPVTADSPEAAALARKSERKQAVVAESRSTREAPSQQPAVPVAALHEPEVSAPVKSATEAAPPAKDESPKAAPLSQKPESGQTAVAGSRPFQVNSAPQPAASPDPAAMAERVAVALEAASSATPGLGEPLVSASDRRFVQILGGRKEVVDPATPRGKQPLASEVGVAPLGEKAVALSEQPAEFLAEDSGPLLRPHQQAGIRTAPDSVPAPPATIPVPAGGEGSFAGVSPRPEVASAGARLSLASGATIPEGQVVGQVVDRLKVERGEQKSRLTMHLHPEELGRVKLDLVAEKDGIRAHLQAQTQQVQEVLERHLPRLREALEQQGVRLEDIQVSVDSGRDGGRGLFQEHRQPQAPRYSASRSAGSDELPSEETESDYRQQRAGGGLSLRV